MKVINKLFLLVSINLLILAIFPFNIIKAQTVAYAVTPSTTAEGNDFATEVLGNAWDMNEYSDISKYLNTSGVTINLSNISVKNGIFSATSATNDPYFFPLFPGYERQAIQLGNYGVNYPIISSKYHCLSTRMKIDDAQYSYDEIRVFWFADDTLTINNQFGVSKSIRTVPNQWHIYQVDLNTTWDNISSFKSWNSMASWQGLRIDPTIQAGVNFAVDWVRLTDCSTRNVTLTWTPTAGNTQMEIWMGRAANTMDTLLAGPISGATGSYTLDTQGWEAGDYYLALKNKSTGAVQWSTLNVQAKPNITIVKPSFTSGDAIVWHMDASSEILTGPGKTRCVNYTMNNSTLDMVTLPPQSIGGGCTASGYSDPQLYFRLPSPTIDTTIYRYLSFHMYTEGSWQDVNRGWIARWLWQYYNNGDPNQWCMDVTHDIPFDVGWEEYSLDLQKLTIGVPEYTVGANSANCPLVPWSTHNINALRFDPNENGMTSSIHQQIDWISLNRMDRVQKGTPFTVKINASQPLGNLTLTFYYTTNPSQPTQNLLTILKPQNIPPTPGNNVYIPLVLNGGNVNGAPGSPYLWDTSNVSLGIYYICIKAIDRVGNTSINCSEAPVQIY